MSGQANDELDKSNQRNFKILHSEDALGKYHTRGNKGLDTRRKALIHRPRRSILKSRLRNNSYWRRNNRHVSILRLKFHVTANHWPE